MRLLLLGFRALLLEPRCSTFNAQHSITMSRRSARLAANTATTANPGAVREASSHYTHN
jgi:hypothetical protein